MLLVYWVLLSSPAKRPSQTIEKHFFNPNSSLAIDFSVPIDNTSTMLCAYQADNSTDVDELPFIIHQEVRFNIERNK